MESTAKNGGKWHEAKVMAGSFIKRYQWSLEARCNPGSFTC